MQLIDTHCHLDFEELADFRAGAGLASGDLEQKAPSGNQEAQSCPHAYVAVSIGRSNWKSVSDLAIANANVVAAFGIHPWWAHEHTPADVDELANWLVRPECMALGEAGLDGTIELGLDGQQTILEPQLKLALQLGKPVLLHCVKASNELLKLLKDTGVKRGIIHAFSGSYEEGAQFVEQGFLLGIGGVITYERARKTRDAVARLPLESLVLETDSPSMPLSGFQGEVNLPSRVMRVCSALAELRDESAESIASQTTANATALFGDLTS